MYIYSVVCESLHKWQGTINKMMHAHVESFKCLFVNKLSFLLYHLA